ncbi:MAG TPA: hypothetical protein VJ747_01105 [Stellaceae bacterium]|nr:hypothetical protein [Stellaceae bacterium]
MAIRSVTSESTTELCERASRACAASREAVLDARDSIVAAKASADHLRRKADAGDWLLLSLLAR